MAYKIKDWDTHYEKAQVRRCKTMSWVAIPNKHDGKGFRRIAKHPDGVSIFGAWVLIVQVASKMPTRGVLADKDGPLTAEDLADKTGFPEKIFEKALKLLSQPRIGWLESTNDTIK